MVIEINNKTYYVTAAVKVGRDGTWMVSYLDGGVIRTISLTPQEFGKCVSIEPVIK